jgi:hypothetical protein
MPKLNQTLTSLLLPSALAALVASTALTGGCDVEPADRSATLDLDLTRYGIDEVVADEGEAGGYLLIGFDGEAVGRVDHEVADDGVELSVELDGAYAELAWGSDEDDRIECRPAADHASTDPIAPCSDGLTIAAEIAEADGTDVPGYTPTGDEPAFRMACDTVTTWVWGIGSCQACYNAAQAGTDYTSHDGGSCTGGVGPWTNCTHRFCGGGGAQLETQLQ